MDDDCDGKVDEGVPNSNCVAGPHAEGEICVLDGTAADKGGCAEGLVCVRDQTVGKGLCLTPCTTGQDCDLPSGQECKQLVLDGDKYCVLTCSQAAMTCPTGASCDVGEGRCLAEP